MNLIALPDMSHMTLFVTASVALLLTPGPAVIYIVARSVSQGRRAGIISTLGIATGTLFHVAAAAFGLSALLLQSALAFGVVKFLGAAYLIWLGIRTLRSKEPLESKEPTTATTGKLFRDGIVVNLLNPKTALFFFAFIPQFVDVAAGDVALQMLFLGLLFVLMGIVSDGGYALAAGTAGQWMRRNPRVLSFQRYLSGTVFLALGVATVLGGSKRQ